jgi:hypothetical protein
MTIEARATPRHDLDTRLTELSLEFVRAARDRNRAPGEKAHAVANFLRLRYIVRREEDGLAARFEALDQVSRCTGPGWILPGRRLVENSRSGS